MGDIVRIEGGVGKGYQGEEAQVNKITKKTMVVVLTTGKHQGKSKTVKPPQCALVQGSTLRSTTKRGRAAAEAPARTAADAPAKTTEGSEASDSYDDEELEEASTKALELLMDEMARDE